MAGSLKKYDSQWRDTKLFLKYSESNELSNIASTKDNLESLYKSKDNMWFIRSGVFAKRISEETAMEFKKNCPTH